MPARIISAIESAQSSRAPTQRFVDSFAKVYTPLVFLIALATAVIPPSHSTEIGTAGSQGPLLCWLLRVPVPW